MHTGKEQEASTKYRKDALSSDSDALQGGSARSDSTRVVKVNCLKTNRRKTRPYCNIKITPTCLDVLTPSSVSLQVVPAKVMNY